MKILTFAIVLLVAGCTVNGYEMENARAVCEKHGGVHHLQYGPPKPFVVCIDGETK